MLGIGIAFLCLMEYVSIGIALADKKTDYRFWWLNFIPFVAFFRIDKITDGFMISIIPVKKWGKTVVILAVVILLFILYGVWGKANLSSMEFKYLKQVIYIPIVACFLIFYFGTIGFTVEVLKIKHRRFKYDALLCATFLATPFLLNVKAREEC